jgi:hypothetical protein
MSRASLITLGVLVAAILGGMLVWKGVQRAAAERDAHEAVRLALDGTSARARFGEYIDRVVRETHAEAFAAAYDSGGLFSPSEWDEQRYIELIFERLASRAAAEGKADLIPLLPGVHGKPEGYQEPILMGGGRKSGA